jgi:hypothetical protein
MDPETTGQQVEPQSDNPQEPQVQDGAADNAQVGATEGTGQHESTQEVEALRDSLTKAERKNLDLENRMAYLEGLISGQGQQPQAALQEPVYDPSMDEQFFDKPTNAAREVARREAEAVWAAKEHEKFQARAKVSAQQAIDRYGSDEYLQAENQYLSEARRDPQLMDVLKVHPDPAEFVYQYIQKRQVSGQSSARIAALEAENAALRSQVKGGPQQAAQQPGAPKPTLPPTNAGARSSGGFEPPPAKTAEQLLDSMLGL